MVVLMRWKTLLASRVVSLSRGEAIVHGPSYMHSVSLANGISTITVSEEPQSVIEQSTIDTSTSYSLPILERAYNPQKSQHGEPGNNWAPSTCQRRRVSALGRTITIDSTVYTRLHTTLYLEWLLGEEKKRIYWLHI